MDLFRKSDRNGNASFQLERFSVDMNRGDLMSAFVEIKGELFCLGKSIRNFYFDGRGCKSDPAVEHQDFYESIWLVYRPSFEA